MAIEFAFALPMLVLIIAGTVEIGSMVSQATALHKGLRAGAAYASQVADPNLTAAERSIIENLVKYGNAAGTGTPLVPGWTGSGSSLVIDTSGVYDPTGANVPIIRLTGAVNYQPIFGGLVPLSNVRIRLSHEQAHVGD